MTKLLSALPSGEANGLAALARLMIDAPDGIHVVVALVDCKKITTDTDTGDVEPTARIRRIEAVLAEDHATARKMLRRAMEQRTGKSVLPLGDVDLITGEILGDKD